MPFSSAADEQRADYRRDILKHDWRPGDPFAPVDPRQTLAVNRLIAHCEGLCASGTLPDETERRLRERVAEALTAFGLPSQAERALT